jgi:hypothetical protein
MVCFSRVAQQRDYWYYQHAIDAGRPGRVNEVFAGGFGYSIVGPAAMDSWFACLLLSCIHPVFPVLL